MSVDWEKNILLVLSSTINSDSKYLTSTDDKETI